MEYHTKYPKTVSFFDGLKEKIFADKKDGVEQLHIVVKENVEKIFKILQDEGFAGWINASKIRTQLFIEADQNFNADAADELFSLWKARKGIAAQTATVEYQARKHQIKAANTGNTQGSSEGPRRKVYRRADIIKLMKTDPERYQALSEEILKAYAEGRVK